MSEINDDILQKLVNNQPIVALGLVTPAGKPHNTPVWINNYKGRLYIFSRASRAKTRYAQQSGECMIAFDWASIRGKIEVFHKGTMEYEEVKDIFDERYGNEQGYEEYKINWDVILRVTPEKILS